MKNNIKADFQHKNGEKPPPPTTSQAAPIIHGRTTSKHPLRALRELFHQCYRYALQSEGLV